MSGQVVVVVVVVVGALAAGGNDFEFDHRSFTRCLMTVAEQSAFQAEDSWYAGQCISSHRMETT